MMTLEEIQSIESYCSENGITIKQRLHELNISESSFYYARRALTARQSTSEGSFIQLGSASGLTFPEPVRSASGSRKGKNIPVESYMTLELRTESGTAMRVQGNFTSHVQSGRQHAVLAVHRACRHAQELPYAERHRQQPDVVRSAQRRRIHLRQQEPQPHQASA